MNIIKLFHPPHYKFYLEEANKIIGKNKDVYSWVKRLKKEDLIVYIKVLGCLNKSCDIYVEEKFIVLTLIIRFFIIELNLDDEIVGLNNKHIKSLIKRFRDILTVEYGYRDKIIKKRPHYSLLVDLNINLHDLT